MITCKSGVTIRTSINEIREAGRATQGVKLIRLDDGDEIAATSIIRDQGEDSESEALEGESGEVSTELDATDGPSNESTIDDTIDNSGDNTPEA
jgi:DNA gyrase subunit A